MGKMITRIRKLLEHKSNWDIELEYLISHGMHLGKNSTINAGCTIDSGWPWLISIGDNVTISSNVTILAHDASTNIVGRGTKLGKVTIGNNVFIGTNAVVLCNTHIGDNVIIGAGSIVTHDLPSNGVYAGAPAVKISTIEEYQRKITLLKESRPSFDHIRKWDQWREAPWEEKEIMLGGLEDGAGFI